MLVNSSNNVLSVKYYDGKFVGYINEMKYFSTRSFGKVLETIDVASRNTCINFKIELDDFAKEILKSYLKSLNELLGISL